MTAARLPSLLVLLAILLVILLSGCGQKGPLYLPPAEPREQAAPVENEADEDQADEDEEGETGGETGA
jgi:predicted small lipoprotein YifL